MWVASLDAESPPGFIRLIGATITRTRNASAGSDLVPSQDIEALPSQLERLLSAFALLDVAGRAEILRHAEQLGGIA